MVGYETSGYVKVFQSDEGADLLEAHHDAAQSLLHAKDPAVWKEHLGASGAFKAFLERDGRVEQAEYITAEENEMQKRIIKGSWFGVLNWYKMATRLPGDDADLKLPAEERKIHVPTVFVE